MRVHLIALIASAFLVHPVVGQQRMIDGKFPTPEQHQAITIAETYGVLSVVIKHCPGLHSPDHRWQDFLAAVRRVEAVGVNFDEWRARARQEALRFLLAGGTPEAGCRFVEAEFDHILKRRP